MEITSLRKTQGAGTTEAEVAGGTLCPACGVPNPPARRFCSGCGKSLRKPCPRCGADIQEQDAFCGACGAGLLSTRHHEAERHAVNLEEARRLLAAHRYEDAEWRLRALAQLTEDHLRPLAEEAQELAMVADIERRRAQQSADAAVAEARALLAAQEYERALVRLIGIPEPLRAPAAQELLAVAQSRTAEYRELSNRLAEAVQTQRLLGMRATIERLLELRTGDEQALQTAQRLRHGVVIAAKQQLSKHGYRQALQLLEQVPAVVRDQDVERLVTAATELEWLWTALQSAAVVDRTLLAIAQRLLKLAPQNAVAAKLYRQLQERASQAPGEPHEVAPNWSDPQSERLGIPVRWIGGLRRLAATAPAAAQLRAHPGRFFVAVGLALQGLDCAAVTVNLAPDENSGMLARLSGRLRKSARAAWGLDLGEAALKAVRLVRADDGTPRVDTVELIEYAQALSQAVDAEKRRDIVCQALAQLRERQDGEDARVFVSLPCNLAIVRSFRLPPMPEKRLPEAVRLEARQQVPFTLDELRWGYTAMQGHDDPSSAGPPWHVIVEATRNHQTEAVVSLCTAAGWKVAGVQSDALALHNLIVYEYLSEAAEEQPAPAIALLDAGASGSRLLVSSRFQARVRTLTIGGESITGELAYACKVTRSRAEQLKREPTSVPRLSRLYATIAPLLQRLADDVQRSLEIVSRQAPEVRLQQLLGVGGGCALHGLLRSLRLPTPDAATSAAGVADSRLAGDEAES